MASNAPNLAPVANTKGSEPDALSFMTKLSPNVYVYRPNTSSAPSSSTTTTADPSSTTNTAPPQQQQPKLIILCAWMGARNPHIAKYVTPYQALYPQSAIVLIKCDRHHFFSVKTARRDTSAAVPFVRSVLDSTTTPTPKEQDPKTTKKKTPSVHIHIWSNGGSSMLLHLHALLLSREKQIPIPPHTIIFDSTPGQFSYSRSLRAFSTGIPNRFVRWTVLLFMHVTNTWYFLAHEFLGKLILRRLLGVKSGLLMGPLWRMAQAQNDTTPGGGRAANEVRRTYIYSDEDELIRPGDVEAHAEQARAERWLDVRMEKFVGSKHVAHLRLDPERYWGVVRETWDGGRRV